MNNPNAATVSPAEAFFSALAVSDDSPLFFRAIRKADKSIKQVVAGSAQERAAAIEELHQLNTAGYGIYMLINASVGRKAADVTRARALFVDFDGGDNHDEVLQAVVADRPAAIVRTSPGRFHAYWPLVGDLPLSDFTARQKQLIARFNTDPAINDLPRIMRLPGFVHIESGSAVQAEYSDRFALSNAEVEQWLGKLPNRHPPVAQLPVAADAVQDDLLISALQALPADDYGTWLRVGLALYHSRPDDGLDIWDTWSSASAKYEAGACAAKWATFETPGMKVTLQTIFYLARQQGWHAPAVGVEGLLFNDRGKLRNLPLNIAKILTLHPDWQGVLGRNTFTNRTEKRLAPPGGEVGEWLDDDITRLRFWVNENYDCDFSAAMCFETSEAIARDNPFDPAQDTLRDYAAAWDGVNRLDSWLVDFLNADQAAGTEYLRELGRCWLTGVAARVLSPGCQRDDVLVLQGAQGLGKTTVARLISEAIAQGAFTSALGDLGGEEARLSLQGVVIAELGELAALGRSQMEATKSFISEAADRIRGKYERKARTVHRTVSFIGTTNDDGYLRDSTGERRWWPVRLTAEVDRERLRTALPQLLGEAAARFLRGEAWHVTDKQALAQATEVRSSCKEEDSLAGEVLLIATGAKNMNGPNVSFDPDQVTTAYILRNLGRFGVEQDRALQMRVSRILKTAGWTQQIKKVDSKTARVWVRL